MNILKQFFNGKLQNQWLNYKLMDVFVRRDTHLHPTKKELIKCFDVANVVVRERARGNGIFTTWFNDAVALAKAHDFDAVYIENVINPRFIEHFRKSEIYVETGCHDIPCFFILLKE